MTASSEGADPVPICRSPAAVVVAHPDDEALWLSSIVASADRVVFCFGALFDRPRDSEARRQALAALPLTSIVDLAVPESGAGLCTDWTDPRPTPTGIQISEAAARARYEANYTTIVEGLRRSLGSGFCDVFTHNPWGEYGHTEHIQVYRAVATLQAELGFTLWFSNYVGFRSWPLARRLGSELRWVRRRVLKPDRVTARKLRRVYRTHGAWTWTRTHYWPSREVLYSVPTPGSPDLGSPLAGEWLLDVARLRWLPPWPFPHRRLPPA
jgi:LmbE family N-acetylglucosaminyl deacetylase